MAPTACGPHLSIPCKNCGLEHEVSMSGLAWSTLRARLLRPVHCPNCGYELPLPTDVPLQREDQLLVDKLVRPQRWDLVMFQPADRPARKAGGVVQRLVGLPGEKVEILAGGVFINGHRLLVAPSEAADKWVLVHDTLHTPTRPVPDGPKWQAAESPSVWKWSGGKWIFHSAKTATGSLAFSGRIADTHPYDATDPARLPALDENAPLVGDVRLETTLESVSGSGTLTFEWQYRGQRAQATIAVSGKATLRVSEFAEENFAVESASQTVPADVPGGLFTTNRVGLAVRNGYAFLLYGGSVLASLPLGGDDPQAAKSRQRRFSGPCRLGIVAAHCSLTLARILLYRDVYYRNPEEMSGIPAQRAVGLAEHPVTLENDAWYLLGDDSTCTGDSRFTGPVRSDALVGIARWIFWPPERWRQFH
jgi:type IV secretory pathway protease TraF